MVRSCILTSEGQSGRSSRQAEKVPNWIKYEWWGERKRERKSYVDILKSADLYRPNVANPRIADPIRAPARLIDINMSSTMIANITLDRPSFVLGGCSCRLDLEPDGIIFKVDMCRSFVVALGRGEGGNAKFQNAYKPHTRKGGI